MLGRATARLDHAPSSAIAPPLATRGSLRMPRPPKLQPRLESCSSRPASRTRARDEAEQLPGVRTASQRLLHRPAIRRVRVVDRRQGLRQRPLVKLAAACRWVSRAPLSRSPSCSAKSALAQICRRRPREQAHGRIGLADPAQRLQGHHLVDLGVHALPDLPARRVESRNDALRRRPVLDTSRCFERIEGRLYLVAVAGALEAHRFSVSCPRRWSANGCPRSEARCCNALPSPTEKNCGVIRLTCLTIAASRSEVRRASSRVDPTKPGLAQPRRERLHLRIRRLGQAKRDQNAAHVAGGSDR